MDLCAWCDEEYDPDEQPIGDEPRCEECGQDFCSTECRDTHDREAHA